MSGEPNKASYPVGSNPPKSLARIRKAIKSMISGRDRVEPGPLRQGLRKTDWVVVQTLGGDASWYRDVLSRNQIKFHIRELGDKTIIQVRYFDLNIARELYNQRDEASENPYRLQKPGKATRSAVGSTVVWAGVGLIIIVVVTFVFMIILAAIE